MARRRGTDSEAAPQSAARPTFFESLIGGLSAGSDKQSAVNAEGLTIAQQSLGTMAELLASAEARAATAESRCAELVAARLAGSSVEPALADLQQAREATLGERDAALQKVARLEAELDAVCKTLSRTEDELRWVRGRAAAADKRQQDAEQGELSAAQMEELGWGAAPPEEASPPRAPPSGPKISDLFGL